MYRNHDKPLLMVACPGLLLGGSSADLLPAEAITTINQVEVVIYCRVAIIIDCP